MGKKTKKYKVIDCGDCIYLGSSQQDFYCILLKEKIKGKPLKNKHLKKLRKAITRFIKTGNTEFCRFFQSFKTSRKPGKKANEFIQGRYESSP